MYYPSWLGIFINPFYFVRKGLLENIKFFAKNINGKLLDVGCGSKPYKNNFKVEEYIGIDLDNKITREKKKAEFFYDGKDLPFEKEIFDVVLCTEVIEHVFEPNKFFNEINRVLKKKGILLLTAPFVWDEHEQPKDFARYSSFGLEYLLKKNNFEILKHKKIVTDFSIIFQLINGYIYRTTENLPRLLRLSILLPLIGVSNILGIIFGKILPNNHDLYLNNIILAKKT